MEKDNEEIRKQIFKRVKPIFEKVLKEKISDTMSVLPTITFFWRPNNYRLKIAFSEINFKPTPPKKPSLPMELKFSNYNSKIQQGLME